MGKEFLMFLLFQSFSCLTRENCLLKEYLFLYSIFSVFLLEETLLYIFQFSLVNVQLLLMLAHVLIWLLSLGRFVKRPLSFDSHVLRTTQSRRFERYTNGWIWYAWFALLSTWYIYIFKEVTFSGETRMSNFGHLIVFSQSLFV